MMRSTTDRSKKLIASYSEQEKAAALIRNGITEKDLDDAYEDGFNQGFKASAIPMIKTCMAGVGAALMDATDFTPEQCEKVLSVLNDKMMWAIEHQELVDETMEKCGIEIVFNDGDYRVRTKRRS